MEKVGESLRQQSTSRPRSPHLIRTRSGTSSTSSSDKNQTHNIIPTKKVNPKESRQQLKRSHSSATKSTTLKERFYEHRTHESKDDNLKLLQRTQSKIDVQRRTRSACTSPSAWALSTGRLSPGPVMKSRGAFTPGRVVRQPSLSPAVPVPKLSTTGKLLGINNRGGKVLTGFWNFLKHTKVSPQQQEENHQLRLMQTRLMQWRFANARAGASINSMKRIVQKKVFNVWIKNSITRNQIAEKRVQIQKIKHQIKLYQIFSSQFDLLKEWTKLEGKNSEALGRLARKLSAISTCLPLVSGSKADLISMHEEMTKTTSILEDVTAITGDMHSQIETTSYMLTELIIFLKEQERYVEELQKQLKIYSPLEVIGESLSVHWIQLLRESKRIEEC